jgi:hypothetical protein
MACLNSTSGARSTAPGAACLWREVISCLHNFHNVSAPFLSGNIVRYADILPGNPDGIDEPWGLSQEWLLKAHLQRPRRAETANHLHCRPIH